MSSILQQVQGISVNSAIFTIIGGIAMSLTADFYFCNRKKYNLEGDVSDKGIRYNAIFSWIIASFTGMTMTAKPVGFGWFTGVGELIPVPLLCILIAMGSYIIFEKLVFKKNVYLEEVTS